MDWILSLHPAISMLLMIIAVLLFVFGTLFLLCLPPMVWCYEGKSFKKLVPIPKHKIAEKNLILYELMKDMWINTDSICFSVGTSDIVHHYSHFLLCDLTLFRRYYKDEEFKVSNEVSLLVREQNLGLYESVYLISDSGNNENWWILKLDHSDPLRYRFRMTRTSRLTAEHLIENADKKRGLSTD